MEDQTSRNDPSILPVAAPDAQAKVDAERRPDGAGWND
jgi:hypothetical protein